MDQFGDQVAGDVEADQGFEAADAGAAYKGRGGAGVGEGGDLDRKSVV